MAPPRAFILSGPGNKLKPVRKKVHSENKKCVSKKNPLVADLGAIAFLLGP